MPLTLVARAAVESLAIPHPGLEPRGVVTVSGGVASFRDADSVDDLLGRADTALYQAKQAGRNTIFRAGAPSGAPAP
jgi:diguanylate cyclase (GGDEF)-like protein